MGWYVHLQVSFACDENDGVAQLAREHLKHMDQDSSLYSRAFLADLSHRSGTNPGPKGGLSLWGIVANGSGIAGEFVEQLRPFWTDLLGEIIEGGPFGFEHIVVLYEEEQSQAANAYEVYWDDPDSPARKLVVRHHQNLPFAWMQA